MSLQFGSRFTFRGVGFPQRDGHNTPTQKTTMFGAIGMSVLRGEPQSGKLSFDVWQDGFSTLALAVAFADLVVAECGRVDTLSVTDRPAVTAELTHASETKAFSGRGTTTGFHVRMKLDFEEIAQ